MKNIHISTRVIFGLFACCLVVFTGCSDSGVERYSLSGKVTYDGKPVSTGCIIFEPDSSKGNKGPQGFTNIENGRYSTDDIGRGAIHGPLIVRIEGQMETSNGPKEKIPSYTTHIDLPKETSTFDFEMPKASR
jgi:hypothetical protein